MSYSGSNQSSQSFLHDEVFYEILENILKSSSGKNGFKMNKSPSISRSRCSHMLDISLKRTQGEMEHYLSFVISLPENQDEIRCTAYFEIREANTANKSILSKELDFRIPRHKCDKFFRCIAETVKAGDDDNPEFASFFEQKLSEFKEKHEIPRYSSLVSR